MSDFGSTFKNARESQGLTLDQIATETRIGARFLGAIETEEFSILPGGIFSRGFVRSYAERLGLDVKKAVEDFERLSNYKEPQVMEGLRVSSERETGNTNRKIYMLAIGTLILVVAGFYIFNKESTISVTASQAPATLSAPPPVPVVIPPAPTAATPATAADPPPVEVPAPIPTRVAVTENQKEPLSLVIEAREASWIKVFTDGSSVIAGEILQPGMTRRFTAQVSITLSTGNAGGLGLRINDREMKPLGKSGQVRSVTITPDTLKDLS